MAIITDEATKAASKTDIKERCKELGLEKLLEKDPEPTGELYRERCILLCGIPIITDDRLPKFKDVLEKKILQPASLPAKSMEFPLQQSNEEGAKPKTKGYCFLVYGSKNEAKKARLLLDQYALDKNHTFYAYSFSALNNIQKPESKWEPPQKEPYIDVGDLWWWLDTPTCQDQFAVQVEHPGTGYIHLAVYWNGRGGADPQVVDNETANREVESFSVVPNTNGEDADSSGSSPLPEAVPKATFKQAPKATPKAVPKSKSARDKIHHTVPHDPEIGDDARKHWSNLPTFEWSPHGSYLVTFHPSGVRLWAGASFQPVKRYLHDKVDFVMFSPSEKFLMTYSMAQRDKTDSSANVFEVSSGELKMSFLPPEQGDIQDFFKWSSDDSYLAIHRPKSDKFHLYDGQFALKEIDLPRLSTFEWNPVKNQIACYCEARENVPAEISICNIVPGSERGIEKVRAVRIQLVSGARLYWQKSGHYFAAYTERHTKAVKVKKPKEGEEEDREKSGHELKFVGVTYHVEIFDCTEKEVPVQTVQFPEQFIDLGWEPKGDKFCVLVQAGPGKVSALIYKLDKGTPAPLLIGKIDGGSNLTTVDWAPQGGWLIVHGAGTAQGQIHFIDASGTSEPIRFRAVEFPGMTKGSWDPTGRFYAACSLSNYRCDDGRGDLRGYRIYSFQGREVVKKPIETLVQFKWRPRPPVYLSDEVTKSIRKNMKALSQKFEEEDRADHMQVSKELLQERRAVFGAFVNLRSENKKLYEEEEAERRSLRAAIDKASREMVKETVITPLSSVVEPVPGDADDKEDD